MRRRSVPLIVLSLLALPAASIAATPIPSGPPSSLAPFQGAPATPRPIKGVEQPPRHPFMARNGRSNIHNDAWQTDAYTWSGPLGRSPRVFSNAIGRTCSSFAFERRGRMVAVCVGAAGPRLYMFSASTLDVLAEFELPPRPPTPPGANLFQDFTGGGYFYLDQRDRIVTATTNRHIFVIAQRAGAPGFRLVRDYDLNGKLGPDDKVNSALPDWSGRLWFVTRTGKVGTVDPRSGKVHVRRLRGEGIQNSFAVDETGGVFIASNRALYRFEASRRGAPRVSWRVRYRNIGRKKPGQADDGTGTTPTLTPDGYVAITDNADPMNVVVFRRAERLGRDRRGRRLRRLVCEEPVFEKGASATENSLISAGRALLVENNYGYDNPDSVAGTKVTAPGFARVDVSRNGRGCRTVWTNRTERAPSVVPKLSLRNGLIYTYTRDPDPSGAQPWFFTTLDFRTGRTVWKQLSGTGTGYNNNYPAITLGPGGTAYLGTLGGVVALRDAG